MSQERLIFTMATSTKGMWTVRRIIQTRALTEASGNIREESLHHRAPSSILFLLQVCGRELTNHLHTAATLGRLSLLSPLQSSFLRSSPCLPPLIKTTLVSSTQRRCHSPKYPERARRALPSTRTQICSVSTLHNVSLLPFCQAHLTSASRPHPPRERSGSYLLCIHYTSPPASTNQEPEQGGRLGKHIVTDLYARLSTGGAERGLSEDWGALSERSFQCRASPSVCWHDARAKATHTHTQE